MATLRRFLWFLLVLSFTESSQSELVREGEEAFLTCPKVEPGQSQCKQTSWVFSPVNGGHVVDLITLGHISSGVPTLSEQLKVSDLSKRLTLTEKCGLKICHVHPQEAGLFHCSQHRKDGSTISASGAIPLSVVSLTEEKEEQSLNLSCVVSFPPSSEITVRWLYNNTVLNDDKDRIKITPLSSGSMLSISKHVLLQEKHRIKCEVKRNDETKEFSFKPNTSKNPDQTNMNENEENNNRNTSSGVKDWHWAVLAGALVLVILVVVLIFWRRLRAKPRDPSTAPQVTHPAPQTELEDGVSYATINYNRKQRSEVRESEEAVTYSSVRTKASEDHLYATVNNTANKTS
ncbi:uncharacterized protein LOC129457415 [Periophthalmus magnuspinnatus]|uniref:uncharacterized protein LOC129457415 n=1 Tax=Periophthalmus magnuspinnatus TaxID=409849 RepID=UPI0024364886|nr:uncharacterized protein LOC129457415 [Periophthalmus magnuspinnatus]